jgi:glucose-1-phosphate cytidylyltransferase
MEVHYHNAEPWKVTLVDTGENTLTGGRLKRVEEYIKDDEAFCFTYGDGIGSNDISKSINFHISHGKLATVTAVQPPGRFGSLAILNNRVTGFSEKPAGDGGYINGGFFVLSPKCLDLIADDQVTWEKEPLMTLAKNNQLGAFIHDGFWQPMDTLRDKNYLEELWASDNAPWVL